MNLKKDYNNKNFWNRYSKIYDIEIDRFNRSAYLEMYKLISKVLTKDMKVLEIATGTGLIAVNVAHSAQSIVATDFSPKMIETATKKGVPSNVHFSVENATALSFPDHTFDAVIISNALHIMPDPGAVLKNIRRVLKPNGLLIAPTFSHGHLRDATWTLNAFLLKMIGFETYSKWKPEEFVDFINQNGFSVQTWKVLKAGFPLVYLEAKLRE